MRDAKGSDIGATQGPSPTDWAKEWRSLLVMVWEIAGLGHEDPEYLSIVGYVMDPIAYAWDKEDWPAYQAACAHARNVISRIPVTPRSTWWPCWGTRGTA